MLLRLVGPLLCVGFAWLAAAPASAADVAVPGKPAPDFTLTDLAGKQVSLSQFKGKTVVLEWYNPECPFVVYAHGKGPLKDLGARWTGKGVVWLAINSGAPGKQGTGLEKNQAKAKGYGITYPVLLDPTGNVGRQYGARTTPHIFIVDAKGTLVYRGGLDNAPLGEADQGKPVPYVENALKALTAGKPIAQPQTPSYGCSVKYAG